MCDRRGYFVRAAPTFRPMTSVSPRTDIPAAAVPHRTTDRLRDFTTDRRLLLLLPMACVVGTGGAAAAWALFHLINLATNLAYFGRWSAAAATIGGNALGPAAALIPVLGGLVIGLMARFGSEKIRGHGIPEAMEAILIGRSRMQPKVAVLKPLSSAISIGTGGPVRRGGADHHDGRRVRLAVRAVLPPVQRRAQDAARRRRRGRHGGDLRHPGRGDAPGRGAAAVRMEAAQLRAGRRGGRHRGGVAAVVAGLGRPVSDGAEPGTGCRRACCFAAGLGRGGGSGLRPADADGLRAARTCSPGCRSTGCGGPHWAALSSASAD